MTNISFSNEEFQALCAVISPELRRIAKRTQGEHTFEDVKNQAWVEVCAVLESGRYASILTPEFQKHLLGRINNLVNKFESKVVRYAIRPEDKGDDEERDKNYWLESATASSKDDPLEQLCQAEERQERETRLKSNYSEAVAYFRLFENYPDRKVIAEHLALSWGWVLHKIRLARKWVQWQSSLFDNEEVIDEDFVLTSGKLKPRKSLSRQERTAIEHQNRFLQRKLFPRAYIPIRVLM